MATIYIACRECGTKVQEARPCGYCGVMSFMKTKEERRARFLALAEKLKGLEPADGIFACATLPTAVYAFTTEEE